MRSRALSITRRLTLVVAAVGAFHLAARMVWRYGSTFRYDARDNTFQKCLDGALNTAAEHKCANLVGFTRFGYNDQMWAAHWYSYQPNGWGDVVFPHLFVLMGLGVAGAGLIALTMIFMGARAFGQWIWFGTGRDSDDGESQDCPGPDGAKPSAA